MYTWQNYLAEQLPVMFQPNGVYSLTEIVNNLKGVDSAEPDARLQPGKLVFREVDCLAHDPRGHVLGPACGAGHPGATGGDRKGASVGSIPDPPGAPVDRGTADRHDDHVRAAAVDPRQRRRRGDGPRRLPRPGGDQALRCRVRVQPARGTGSTSCGWAISPGATWATPGRSTRASPRCWPTGCPRPSCWSGSPRSWRWSSRSPSGSSRRCAATSSTDHAFNAFSTIFYATPAFLIGIVAILVFAIKFPILPPEGPQGEGLGAVFTNFNALILPITTPGADDDRAVQQVHALLGAGQPHRGLRPHRPGQGGQRTAGADRGTCCATR